MLGCRDIAGVRKYKLVLCCRYMYWGQAGEAAGIYQAGLDGSNRRHISSRYVEHPTGMTFGMPCPDLAYSHVCTTVIQKYVVSESLQ